MVGKIKKSMRISHTALDEDIESNIDVCIADLKIAGVYYKEGDALSQKACELYVKWQYDYMGKGEQF